MQRRQRLFWVSWTLRLFCVMALLGCGSGESSGVRVDPTTGDRTIVSGRDPETDTLIGSGPEF